MPNHEQYVKHRAKVLAYNKEYREKHREERREHEKQRRHNYYLAHREEETKYAIEWNKNNRPKFNKNRNDYLKKHPEKRAEIHKKYQLRNPEKHRARIITRYIPLAEQCEFCDSVENLEHHHPDYIYPTIFVTVCKECHEYVDSERDVFGLMEEQKA